MRAAAPVATCAAVACCSVTDAASLPVLPAGAFSWGSFRAALVAARDEASACMASGCMTGASRSSARAASAVDAGTLSASPAGMASIGVSPRRSISASSRDGLMLPQATASTPASLARKAHRRVTVVLPLVPVMATTCVSAPCACSVVTASMNRSSSPTTGMPRRRAAWKSCWPPPVSMDTPGLQASRSKGWSLRSGSTASAADAASPADVPDALPSVSSSSSSSGQTWPYGRCTTGRSAASCDGTAGDADCDGATGDAACSTALPPAPAEAASAEAAPAERGLSAVVPVWAGPLPV